MPVSNEDIQLQHFGTQRQGMLCLAVSEVDTTIQAVAKGLIDKLTLLTAYVETTEPSKSNESFQV